MQDIGFDSMRADLGPPGERAAFHALLNNQMVGFGMTLPDKRWLRVNNRWSEMIGYSPEELSTIDWAQLTHPDDLATDLEQFDRLVSGQIDSYLLEKRFIRKDGKVLHTGISVNAVRGADATLKYGVKLAVDISQRKPAEDSLAHMRRKLIEAQEQERARIGRELHDDTSQKLALLALDIGRITGNSADISSHLKALRAQVDQISKDIHALSHDLHAANLEYLGVVDGIGNWCTVFGERHKMLVTFSSDVQTILPHQTGISLFRIAQEALQNALKHSGTNQVEVRFVERSNEIHLLIRDLGRGFAIDHVHVGLGLISMRERARLIGGTLTIDSGPERGTSIEVRVPLQ